MDAYLDSLTRPRPRSKAPAQEGPDLFTTVQAVSKEEALRIVSPEPFDLSEGVRRKEAALREFNERGGEVIRWLRHELALLCRVQGCAVSADDAVLLLAARLDCDLDDVPTGPWMGALFRSSEWEFSHWTVSERTSNNGRSLRAWRLR